MTDQVSNYFLCLKYVLSTKKTTAKVSKAQRNLKESATTKSGKKCGHGAKEVRLKHGLKTAMSISTEGNAYLQESQFWKLYKEGPPSCSIVIKASAGLVYLLATLLESFMPSFSKETMSEKIKKLENVLDSKDKVS
ncbi:methionine--tRNA ligase [Canna indica]|uniref:Methionine--tRNA ligase n=1 Tax=Canna indica TaxID=4628 RepID=A0AAQ3QPR7_9LILI|nr:methionine--tRNA ligase [Canna indica]